MIAPGAHWRARCATRRPPPKQAEIAHHLAALEAAVRRIEAERVRSERADDDSVCPAEPDQSPLAESWRLRRPVWIAVTLVVAALCAGAYVFWSGHRAASLASRVPVIGATTSAAAMTKDGDIPPGITAAQ